MGARRNVVEALEGRRLFSFPFGVGSTGADRVVSVAEDRAGNVFVTGTYQGTVDFDPGAGTAELSGGGGFVARYAADGSLVWARSFTGATPAKVAVDKGGSVYFAGNFSGTVDFDPRKTTHNVTALAGTDGFVCMVTARGNLGYVTRLGGREGDVTASGLAVDRNGSAYVGGTFGGRVNFRDPTVLEDDVYAMSANDGVTDGYIARLDSTGALIWSGSFSGSTDKTLTDVALDDGGNVMATGLYSGTVDFNPKKGSFAAVAATQQAYVLKWDADGDFAWMGGLGGTGETYATTVTADRAGNVYVMGQFSGLGDFNPSLTGTLNLAAPATGQTFITKLNASGTLVWARSLGGSTDVNVAPGEIAVDKGQNVYLTGQFRGTRDFDPGAGTSILTSQGLNDVFVTKLNASGELLFARRVGGTASDTVLGTVLTRDGSLLMTGSFTGTANLATTGSAHNVGSGADEDGFVLKLTGAGDPA
jgi:hypothetical protein